MQKVSIFLKHCPVQIIHTRVYVGAGPEPSSWFASEPGCVSRLEQRVVTFRRFCIRFRLRKSTLIYLATQCRFVTDPHEQANLDTHVHFFALNRIQVGIKKISRLHCRTPMVDLVSAQKGKNIPSRPILPFNVPGGGGGARMGLPWIRSPCCTRRLKQSQTCRFEMKTPRVTQKERTFEPVR